MTPLVLGAVDLFDPSGHHTRLVGGEIGIKDVAQNDPKLIVRPTAAVPHGLSGVETMA